MRSACITEEMHWSPPLQIAYCENLGSVTAVLVKLSGNFILAVRQKTWK